jgi:SH3-like domain-containing protein
VRRSGQGAYCLSATVLAAALVAVMAHAAEYRSTVEAATVLYDAPSVKAAKVGLLGREYPVEIIVSVEGWVKIRDAAGELAWVQKPALADKRMLIVRASVAEVRAAPDANSALLFKAEQGVLLELADPSPVAAFVKVRHRDGQSGYVRIADVWGS